MRGTPDTTGKPDDDPPEAFAVNRTGLPVKVFDPRRKLYRKAKREPAFRFYTLRGYPAKAFRHIDHFVLGRLCRHLKRRSQRPCRPPEGVSWYEHPHRLGLVPLSSRG